MLRAFIEKGVNMSGAVSAAIGNAVPAKCRALAGIIPSTRNFGSPSFEKGNPSFKTGFAATAAGRNFAAYAAATSQEALYQDNTIGMVEWNAQLVNAVSLVGRLGGQIEVRPAGRSQVAKCSLAVNTGKDRPASWFDLEIWGELAGNAAAELKKGDQVQVLGRLRNNEWTDKEGNKRKSVTVAVNSVNRVQPYGMAQSQDPWSVDHSQEVPLQPGYDDQTAGLSGWGESAALQQQQAQSPMDTKWAHLLSNWNEYYDNRQTKRSPRAPDFKHKQSGDALWLSSAPQYVKEQLAAGPPS